MLSSFERSSLPRSLFSCSASLPRYGPDDSGDRTERARPADPEAAVVASPRAQYRSELCRAAHVTRSDLRSSDRRLSASPLPPLCFFSAASPLLLCCLSVSTSAVCSAARPFAVRTDALQSRRQCRAIGAEKTAQLTPDAASLSEETVGRRAARRGPRGRGEQGGGRNVTGRCVETEPAACCDCRGSGERGRRVGTGVVNTPNQVKAGAPTAGGGPGRAVASGGER